MKSIPLSLLSFALASSQVLLPACTPGEEGGPSISFVCRNDEDCNDHVYCNGTEYCQPDSELASPGGCVKDAPCSVRCDEGLAACVMAPEGRKPSDCPPEASSLSERDVCHPLCSTDLDCDDGAWCNGAEVCDPESPLAQIDGCAPAPSPCRPDQIYCDEYRDICMTECDLNGDADGDGHDSIACGGDDCDDSDAGRFPGNVEICDVRGIDEDCDPSTFGERDSDGDGYFDARCYNLDAAGERISGNDCNDLIAEVHPSATETCNGIDDNCNGDVDEGLRISMYPDADGDGFGEHGATAQVSCPWEQGLADNDADCDDDNASLFPGQIVCLPGQQGLSSNYRMCQTDGTTLNGSCPMQSLCYPQPGGFGICN